LGDVGLKNYLPGLALNHDPLKQLGLQVWPLAPGLIIVFKPIWWVGFCLFH
jgi:hypothetical protein